MINADLSFILNSRSNEVAKEEGVTKQNTDWIPVLFFHGKPAKFIRD